jgi:hypothetical protein
MMQPGWYPGPTLPAYTLVSCSASSSTLMMEATRSSESSVHFKQNTWRYIPEDRTLYNHRCENLISYAFLKSQLAVTYEYFVEQCLASEVYLIYEEFRSWTCSCVHVLFYSQIRFCYHIILRQWQQMGSIAGGNGVLVICLLFSYTVLSGTIITVDVSNGMKSK